MTHYQKKKKKNAIPFSTYINALDNPSKILIDQRNFHKIDDQ